MIKKEMIAMLLAGGQGSRLGVLTEKVAKPAVAFGGKYRIIDFPLSNCINSGIDTVGVLTQYQPLRLNTHIGIGIPWDLDRNEGGVTVLPPVCRCCSVPVQDPLQRPVSPPVPLRSQRLYLMHIRGFPWKERAYP